MVGPEFDWKNEPVLGICGQKGSGRAILIDDVKDVLVKRGLRVAELVHVSNGSLHSGPDRDLKLRASALLTDHDIILIQGDATTPGPLVWCGNGISEADTNTIEDCRRYLASGSRRVEITAAEAMKRLEEVQCGRPVFGAILIGGASRRMGFPKHLAVVGGETLLERVVTALDPEVERTLVVGAGELPEGMSEYERVFDEAGCGTGPVAGILTALRSAPRACWVVTACDMAAIGVDAVRWLLGQRGPGRWAVLPRCGDRVEPLLALYEPQAFSLLDGLRVAGRLAPRELVGSDRVFSPAVPRALCSHWTNVNRRTDLDRIRIMVD